MGELPVFPDRNRHNSEKDGVKLGWMKGWLEDARLQEKEALRQEREESWSRIVDRFNHHREMRDRTENDLGPTERETVKGKKEDERSVRRTGNTLLLRCSPEGERSLVLHMEPGLGRGDVSHALDFLKKHTKRYLTEQRIVEISLSIPG